MTRKAVQFVSAMGAPAAMTRDARYAAVLRGPAPLIAIDTSTPDSESPLRIGCVHSAGPSEPIGKTGRGARGTQSYELLPTRRNAAGY
jgi:hypothetical protein